MNFLKKLFGGETQVGARASGRTSCILDGERFVEGRGSPGERAGALKRLSQFAAREKISLTVVFAGRPLREVAEDDTFEGVKVFFCERAEDIGARLRQLAQDAGSGSCLVIVADRQLDKELSDSGFRTMRVSTLKKAFEAEGGDERPGGEGGEGRRTMRRPRMDRRDGHRDRRGDRDRDRDRSRDAAPRAEEPAAESAPAEDAPPPAAPEAAPYEGSTYEGSPAESAPPPAAPEPAERAPAPRPPPNAAVKSLIDLVE